jgi:hypothetical protein
MKTGPELHKRNLQPADRPDKARFNSTALTEEASAVQKATQTGCAARPSAKNICASMTGSLCVLTIIRNSQAGVDPKTLKQMTGFNRKKVHRILYKLFKHGEIRIESGGLYAGVRDAPLRVS